MVPRKQNAEMLSEKSNSRGPSYRISTQRERDEAGDARLIGKAGSEKGENSAQETGKPRRKNNAEFAASTVCKKT